MSTVMHAYKVPKNNFWNVLDEIREFYKNNNGIVQTALESEKDYFELSEAIRNIFNESSELSRYDTRLQLFDFGDDYIFRVLEPGYFFMNNADEFSISPVFYDDRTDVPPDEEETEQIAIEIDNLL